MRAEKVKIQTLIFCKENSWKAAAAVSVENPSLGHYKLVLLRGRDRIDVRRTCSTVLREPLEWKPLLECGTIARM